MGLLVVLELDDDNNDDTYLQRLLHLLIVHRRWLLLQGQARHLCSLPLFKSGFCHLVCSPCFAMVKIEMPQVWFNDDGSR